MADQLCSENATSSCRGPGARGRELSKLGGVHEVEVDLDTGKVTVTSDTGLDRATVQAAVDEAGYELIR